MAALNCFSPLFPLEIKYHLSGELCYGYSNLSYEQESPWEDHLRHIRWGRPECQETISPEGSMSMEGPSPG